MSVFITTLIIAFIIVLLALALLGIGWLLSGKVRIVRGACGMNPEQRRKGACGDKIQCDLCERKIEKPEDADL